MSGHLELGWALGANKYGYVLFDKVPDRYDVMYKFATDVFFDDWFADPAVQGYFFLINGLSRMPAGLCPPQVNYAPYMGPQSTDNAKDPAISGVDLFMPGLLVSNPKAPMTKLTATVTGLGWFVFYGATAW